MECNFHVGQKVVCVDDSFWPKKMNTVSWIPEVGAALTIRDIFLCPKTNIVGLRFVDRQCMSLLIPNQEYGLQHFCFRPASLITTDISVFTAMLVKPPSELVRV
jgi:hypothetical protein